MEDSSSVNVILEFLKSNKFDTAEAARRNVIGNRTDLNGFMQDLRLELGKSSQISDEASKEAFIVKVMENGTARNGSDSKFKNVAFVNEKNRSPNISDETMLDLYSRNFSSSNGSVDLYQNNASTKSNNASYLATTERNNALKSLSCLAFPVILEKHTEELPRLPPVKLKSDDKLSSITWEEKYQRGGPGSKPVNVDSTYFIGSFLDVPIGQEISSSGGKRLAGGNWFSVSQGITEDTSDLVSGFATIGDSLSESFDYPNDYWDSDEYDDDDDVGYMRQPIEDETWFLAHEIDYPSDTEKKTDPEEKILQKNDDDDLSFADEDSYLSGDQYFHSKNVGPVTRSGERIDQYDRPHLDDLCVDEEQRGSVTSVRSIGVGINSDMADFGSERELDGISSHDSENKYVDRNTKVKISKATSSGKSTKNVSDDKLLTGGNNEDDVDGLQMADSSPSTLSNNGYADWACQVDQKVGILREDVPGGSLEDEEAAAVQEQVNQIKAQEGEYETFNLKILHRKNRTGFEEDKNFNVVLNSVIGGRYQVTEYLGSAAFSKAVQAHDLHTGMDVCVKIIKNNKDFFDQSLDEIKLLKFINKHDPGDKYHLLRLYDYFYYREHLLIVCELLKANLYEFHKFNRESGGEVYFTMPRLQSITIQCLEALEFLHGLGLIHCDLKPENILVKSYSRCEVKVIDLGSSCFETDHLCSYVQSRSYRAPEVILGLPYDKKIDIWSLGCILAELCTGNVLFQNDSPATLLARVIGVISPIGQDMLAKGRDTYKYFSKNHMLYERNQDTNRLEYLIPKKTSLRHRLPMGDEGFIDFVSYLLEINPKKRPSATKALKHPWLSYPYEPISS
ncbi:putative dual-specificity kinase CMGC-DYRK-PRP4 family [Helianthus annuus]|nr:dual specificity tyrosine-phosphorylation-regulated kinase mbk-2 isoform X1 [Helianthus annuus]XP_022038452.1 dual specificity tyrosine-phosphorylation-regulated kinase mbk-2 isoform X1 [Helianthus annuus]XP_035846454.1 dual specificity tyrosine-phosphorylation-regulated kinase mbk-2 isoform X1 [Helianthus annuus]XP_035846455.1 dual specificity tyrosine-phosphorylation-regulated kinase mbk-2 isoform X1 [Helianthus annuus]KAF5806023.1 putative dual-specificity kinase CMGC-DYRK-PRP4 family [He